VNGKVNGIGMAKMSERSRPISMSLTACLHAEFYMPLQCGQNVLKVAHIQKLKCIGDMYPVSATFCLYPG